MKNLSVAAFDKAYFLFDLARLHRKKWQKTGDMKLLKIAHDLEKEGKLYMEKD